MLRAWGGEEELDDCRGPGDVLPTSGLVLLVLATANPPLPQQGQRRGPARSHGMKKSRERDQVSVQ